MRRLQAAAILVGCAPAASAAPPSVDSQVWSELDATHSIAANWFATAILTTRLGNDLPNPTLIAGGLQIDYRCGSWTATGSGYYVSIRNAESGARTAIWLPAAALTYVFDIGSLAFSDRNRLEQLEGLPGAPARYRNRIGADWHIPGQHAVPDIVVADEVFYDFSRDHWTRNRAQVGLQFYPAPNSRLQTYYMRQTNTYGAPDRLNVLGFTLQFDINK
jgi:hypothetical protein